MIRRFNEGIIQLKRKIRKVMRRIRGNNRNIKELIAKCDEESLDFLVNKFCHVCKRGYFVPPEDLGFDSDGSVEICNGEFIDYKVVNGKIVPFRNQCTNWRVKR